ncbi:alpha/beta-hydrolase [Zopfia rhizophila CBS 207.26]|uniref:Alpha/beta-hydrolase n=1 Tax=Zopfia rhizophila CBS 207.26 TaxID=1314779 RepID=A0A6A6EBQ3_9PEZI|nr:alpha/beta-hydrolase [Zopfia rhizophila CBS 207.26]
MEPFPLIRFHGQIIEVSQRKGFSPDLKRVPEPPKQKRFANETDSYRFYKNNTARNSLTQSTILHPFATPDIPFDLAEFYSSLIPIDMSNTSRALSFIFQPTVGEPVNEITIWLNGGPGRNLTNVLWVEQPAGTGFSIGEVKAMSEEDIAKHFAGFFLNFQRVFGISKFKIFVIWESYTGRYIPYISVGIIDSCNKEHFNISGALLSLHWIMRLCPRAGCSGPLHPGTQGGVDCDVWGMGHVKAYHPIPCFNIYEIGLQCPLLSDPLGYLTALQYSYSDEGDLSPDPIKSILPVAIGKTNRVLVANGALGCMIITDGALISIQNMTWNGAFGFQDAPNTSIDSIVPDLESQEIFNGAHNPQGIMESQHCESGLMWAHTYLSGYM